MLIVAAFDSVHNSVDEVVEVDVILTANSLASDSALLLSELHQVAHFVNSHLRVRSLVSNDLVNLIYRKLLRIQLLLRHDAFKVYLDDLLQDVLNRPRWARAQTLCREGILEGWLGRLAT